MPGNAGAEQVALQTVADKGALLVRVVRIEHRHGKEAAWVMFAILFVRLLSNLAKRIATAGWRQCAKPLAIQHNMERMDMVEVPVELWHAQGQGVRRQTRKGGRTAEVA